MMENSLLIFRPILSKFGTIWENLVMGCWFMAPGRWLLVELDTR